MSIIALLSSVSLSSESLTLRVVLGTPSIITNSQAIIKPYIKHFLGFSLTGLKDSEMSRLMPQSVPGTAKFTNYYINLERLEKELSQE